MQKRICLVMTLLMLCGLAAPARAQTAQPQIAAGDTVVFGSYEQDGNPENGTEPIQWLVLDVRDGGDAAGAGVLLISQFELAYRPMYEQQGPATWETCDVRPWLNGEFFQTAFTGQQQAFIALSPITTPGNRDPFDRSDETKKTEISGGNDTEDYVFLLSYEEAKRSFYFGTTSDYSAMGYRLTAPTYTAAADAWRSDSSDPFASPDAYRRVTRALPRLVSRGESWDVALPSLDDYASFWTAEVTLKDYVSDTDWSLRTPGYEEGTFCSLCGDGSLYQSGRYDDRGHFIRPVLWLNAEAIAQDAVAEKATPVSPNTLPNAALAGTWAGQTDQGAAAFVRFDPDGYHMSINVQGAGITETVTCLYEAGEDSIRLMLIGYQGDETNMTYRLPSPDTLELTNEGETQVFTRVADGA